MDGISVIQVRTSVKKSLEEEKESIGISYSEMIERMLVVWRQYQKELPSTKLNGGE